MPQPIISNSHRNKFLPFWYVPFHSILIHFIPCIIFAHVPLYFILFHTTSSYFFLTHLIPLYPIAVTIISYQSIPFHFIPYNIMTYYSCSYNPLRYLPSSPIPNHFIPSLIFPFHPFPHFSIVSHSFGISIFFLPSFLFFFLAYSLFHPLTICSSYQFYSFPFIFFSLSCYTFLTLFHLDLFFYLYLIIPHLSFSVRTGALLLSSRLHRPSRCVVTCASRRPPLRGRQLLPAVGSFRFLRAHAITSATWAYFLSARGLEIYF